MIVISLSMFSGRIKLLINNFGVGPGNWTKRPKKSAR